MTGKERGTSIAIALPIAIAITDKPLIVISSFVGPRDLASSDMTKPARTLEAEKGGGRVEIQNSKFKTQNLPAREGGFGIPNS